LEGGHCAGMIRSQFKELVVNFTMSMVRQRIAVVFVQHCFAHFTTFLCMQESVLPKVPTMVSEFVETRNLISVPKC
jgi:hypothetical protein